MARLSQDQIAAKLKSLSGWEFKDDTITRLLRFKEFMDGIGFINRVAEIAEAADHHPDITINYTRIRFTCTTHSEGGVTERDFKLADEIDRAYTTHPH